MPAVVITGGSDGIGLALAKAFNSHEHAIVLIARDQETLSGARNTLGQPYRSPVFTLSLDIREPAAVRAITEFLTANDLYADILINSAGTATTGDFAVAEPDRLTTQVDLNVTALTRLCRAFLPAMLTRGRGGIINVSSVGGFVPGPYQAAYYASKAYVISLTRALAHETRGQGVRIATLAPGPVNTEFHARADGAKSLYRRILPALSAEQVAASAKRGYDWGHTIIVPGIFSTLMALAVRIVPGMITIPIVAILLNPSLLKPSRAILDARPDHS
jgi:short-subunit dehydrogenase